MWQGPGAVIPLHQNMNQAVRRLRAAGYSTAVLTNNYKFDRAGLIDRTPIDRSLFDAFIESTVEGVMKPNRAIFEITQSRLPEGIEPEEVIFLDDLQENVDAAIEFGWTPIKVNTKNVQKAIEEMGRLLGLELLD